VKSKHPAHSLMRDQMIKRSLFANSTAPGLIADGVTNACIFMKVSLANVRTFRNLQPWNRISSMKRTMLKKFENLTLKALKGEIYAVPFRVESVHEVSRAGSCTYIVEFLEKHKECSILFMVNPLHNRGNLL